MNHDRREETPRPAAGGAALGRSIAGAAGEVAGGVAGALIGGVARRIADALDPQETTSSEAASCCGTETAADADGERAATPTPGYSDPYRTYRPAYAYGRGARDRHADAGWDDIEAELARGWQALEDRLEVSWEQAKDAVRDGWNRVEGSFVELFREQDEHWRERYADRPYVTQGASYDTYRPAYRYGAEQRLYRYDRDWEDVSDEIARDWARLEARARGPLTWDEAEYAVRDGWHYVESRMPGDYDRDGR